MVDKVHTFRAPITLCWAQLWAFELVGWPRLCRLVQTSGRGKRMGVPGEPPASTRVEPTVGDANVSAWIPVRIKARDHSRYESAGEIELAKLPSIYTDSDELSDVLGASCEPTQKFSSIFYIQRIVSAANIPMCCFFAN